MPAVTERTSVWNAYRIAVRGHVQGVGFRPFVQRLADECGLAGRVGNDQYGVLIEIEGDPASADIFLARLDEQAPPAACIEQITIEPMPVRGFSQFQIVPGEAPRGPLTARVPRDRAVCADCLNETTTTDDRRFGYPFTTCTACGPRYTLIQAMPYERHRTAMESFELCPSCRQEFNAIGDHRFHAEVMACPLCGPQVEYREVGGVSRGDAAIERAAAALMRGEILALKGVGGYQLLVRADDAAAVVRLRTLKRRPTKPLAVMAASLEAAEDLVHLDHSERNLIVSSENPIVIARRNARTRIADEVAPGLQRLGVVLPTTPLHHRLLALVAVSVVATSANRGDEPILGDEATLGDLLSLADSVLWHDRPIVRRIDDSVVQIIAGRASTIRLARGLAPLPLVHLERFLRASGPPHGVAAVGGHQKNAIALWTGSQAILGPHVGDLDSLAARTAWQEHIRDLERLYQTQIRSLIVDRHPGYAATRWAEDSGLPVIAVDHHHAHAATAMVEHNLLDRRVLALAWDGTGLGPDETLWGGECLVASLGSYERAATLHPIPLLGGEAAIHEPWRIGVALARAAQRSRPAWSDVAATSIARLEQLFDRSLGIPTTSMGRLFDGVASLILGISRVTYEGEAAVRLEAIVDLDVDEEYPIETTTVKGTLNWDWRRVVASLCLDRDGGIAPSTIAAKFHNSLVRWAEIVARRTAESDVVLTGGCFQNAVLTQRIADRLEAIGKRVHRPGMIPVNDGGLAAGQLAVGLARLHGANRSTEGERCA